MRSHLVLGERGIEAVVHFTCPSRMISKALHFVIDTGSELSFLGWKDTILAGIEVGSLPALSPTGRRVRRGCRGEASQRSLLRVS
jgi:hypothetical protein